MSYKTSIKTIPGQKVKNITLFALSTCIWCKKTKALFNDLGLEYSFVDVDLLFGSDREEAYAEMEKHNSEVAFPTIVINNGESVIVGFEEVKIRKLKENI